MRRCLTANSPGRYVVRTLVAHQCPDPSVRSTHGIKYEPGTMRSKLSLMISTSKHSLLLEPLQFWCWTSPEFWLSCRSGHSGWLFPLRNWIRFRVQGPIDVRWTVSALPENPLKMQDFFVYTFQVLAVWVMSTERQSFAVGDENWHVDTDEFCRSYSPRSHCASSFSELRGMTACYPLRVTHIAPTLDDGDRGSLRKGVY